MIWITFTFGIICLNKACFAVLVRLWGAAILVITTLLILTIFTLCMIGEISA